MENKSSYQINEQGVLGEVKIADDVIAVIAGIAATEVTGVARMCGNITNELVSKLGVNNLSKGVKVVVENHHVRVNLALELDYGVSIPEISKKVQDRVKAAIENMTGLKVREVNVRVTGVAAEEEKAKSDGTDNSSVFVSQKGTLMKRSEVREHIFRILFCVEFCEKEEFEDQVELYFHGHENINEKTQKEITEKTENLIEHLDEIDEQISAHTNAWNLERLGKAELSILRLATYEILLDEQVPRKVAINEAVELAKKYCNEKAAPFINGVLSKIGQDMDEE